VLGTAVDAERVSLPALGTFVPRIRLFTEPLLFESEGARGGYEEVEVPVLSLVFDYDGVRLRSSDPERTFFRGHGGSLVEVERDRAGEARVQRMLEAFGAVELECLEHCVPGYDSQADYLVQVDESVHSYCSFMAFAVPQLRKHGCEVEIDQRYPYQVVDTEPRFYADIEPAGGEGADWFNLELGIELDGRTVNLLPALLEILDGCTSASSLKALLRMPARYRAVSVGENRYITLPPDRLSRLLQALLELYQGETSPDGSLRFSGLQAASLEGLGPALGAELTFRRGTELAARGRALRIASEAPPALSAPGLNASLRSYQQQGLGWLQHLREHAAAGILADDMGLGKTLQTIAHILLEKESGRADAPTLIVMPTSLVGNWSAELRRFAPSLSVCVWHGTKRRERQEQAGSCDVLLTTYPLLIRDLDWLKGQRYYLVVLDESQAIKNRRSLAHRAVKDLDAEHRLCLTGTPVENNLDELWALFDFLMPGFLGDAQRFRAHFRDPIERDGNDEKLGALRARLSPFILRRMKEQVARDLPPKTELVRPVELRADQRELYEHIRVAAHNDVRRAIRKKGIEGSTITILDGLMKLRQVCCDPRLVSVPSARRVAESAKHELFFDLLAQQLEQGRRVLVFSQFARMLALLSHGLGERKIRHVLLTGATQHRERVIEAFQKGAADVFLISLKAGGTGLNLTQADTVIHYDPWWNAAAQSQATDRAYRIGQSRPVFVYRLIVAGSVEERMLRLQQRKQHLANAILGGGGAAPPTLTHQEVEDLFAPLTDV
jgi:superfamily II DNA or RNA helicase